MAGKKQSNKYVIERVIQKGWDYLNDNFHSFSTSQKIQISLELCKKSMPVLNENSGEVKVTVKHESIEERLQIFN